jgi:hypothetical protein
LEAEVGSKVTGSVTNSLIRLNIHRAEAEKSVMPNEYTLPFRA